MASPYRTLRAPVALEPRIQEMDRLLRRQRKEIEDLRASLALVRTGQGGGWWNEGDISLKVAKLLRVLRVKYVRPHSLLERLAQWVSGVADAWLEAERTRLLSEEDLAAEPPASLGEILTLADPYTVWRKRVEPELDRRSGLRAITRGPLISVVLPVYRIAPRILEATLRSLRAQTYQDWEACIGFADADGEAALALLQRYAKKDPRIRLEVLEANYGIAGNSNAALKLARGDYIALLDHDDELPPLALSRMAAAIAAEPQADFLYTDKEILSEAGDRHYQPLFKPEWSPEMLYSVNYLTHLNLIRADLMSAIGGWAMGVDGAQDWDLFLRATEQAACVLRVPGVGYSWRVHQASTASGLDAKPYALQAQLRTLERHAERTNLPGWFEANADTGFQLRWLDPAPVRVVILGGPDLTTLETLIGHLARERKSFTGVDVLLAPADCWRFSSAWRQRHGPLPGWCRLIPILADDPVEACRGVLAAAQEPVTVVLDGGMLVCTPGALTQLAGWMALEPIAFASGVTVENDQHVVEAGCVLDSAAVAHPLFRGEVLRQWNVFGGALWHRNVELASPYLLALRTHEAHRALAEAPRGDWRGVFHHVCQVLVAEREGGRGVVDPNARAILALQAAYPAPAEGMIGTARRYLHPFLTIGPAGGIALVKDVPHEAAVLAA
ncbi:glycosyltransferase [Caulobacter sp. S45]|uniref:glycosyltransferase family 2 protein n=1 Tax=Caulobacter sp. S45 TaxID=1641861 RepID=UPI0015770244|nr:glycosyltransferase [Caulobacter sp. S45]